MRYFRAIRAFFQPGLSFHSMYRIRTSLDTPAPKSAAGEVLFSGWICHESDALVSLDISIDGQTIPCETHLQSPDVAQAFPDFYGTAACRFQAQAYVPPKQTRIRLIATFNKAGRQEVLLPPMHEFIAPKRPSTAVVQARRVKRFVVFAYQSARQWKARRNRLPTFSEIPGLVRKTRALFRGVPEHEGQNLTGPAGFEPASPIDRYTAWQEVNHFGSRSKRLIDHRLAQYPQEHLPKISIIMPVYRPPIKLLLEAVESVFSQHYRNWELCIADDASESKDITSFLSGLAASDPRVKVVTLEKNGNISAATNAAAQLATGEFLTFLDHDDLLAPDALAEVAAYVLEQPQTDYLYTDDDKVDVDGNRFAPQFKPDWSPELLLSYMYCAHLIVVRRSLYETLGGMRLGFEGSQDYDFALRATEHARHVGHIPKVLYHWRVLEGSTAVSGDAKPASFNAGLQAVKESLARRGMPQARAYRPEWAIKSGLGLFAHEFLDEGPLVTILIPTKNQEKLLRQCLQSLQKTTYKNYQVVIIDNDSDDPRTLDLMKASGHRVLRISSPNNRFSFAYINNQAVQAVESDYVLFLNNDTEVIEPRWLSQMMGYAQLSGVGAVGARLLYSDKRIQHAGIVHGYYHGLAGPAFKLSHELDGGYLSYVQVARNYSAVTAACLLTPRKVFQELNGFDEAAFAVAYNDVDYCYRLIAQGLRCVYTPTATLYHHEGVSRGFKDNPQEVAAFRKKYQQLRDPFYNPNLSLENEQFQIQSRCVLPASRTLDRPVKTLMTAFNLNLEGAPYSQYELTLALKQLGVIDPIVYCPNDGPLRARYEAAGIPVEVFEHPLRDVYELATYEPAITRFAAFMRDRQIELVYANTLQTFYAIAAAHEARVPSIWNVREGEPWQTYFNHFGLEVARRALECFAYPYRTIFVSEASRKVYRVLDQHHRFSVIPNGLDLSRLEREASPWPRQAARQELGLPDEKVMILLLGTVCDRKGQIDLVHALRDLPVSIHDKIACYIVGDRDSVYSRDLKKTASTLPERLRGAIKIIPETHDIALYYRAADIFTCTSRVESYPRVILEAMAFGLPIVTTPVFGIPEQVQEGVNALFYSPHDTKTLARHLQTLIENQDLRAQMAQSSPHVLATRTNFQEMVEQYGQAFAEAALSGDAITAAQAAE